MLRFINDAEAKLVFAPLNNRFDQRACSFPSFLLPWRVCPNSRKSRPEQASRSNLFILRIVDQTSAKPIVIHLENGFNHLVRFLFHLQSPALPLAIFAMDAASSVNCIGAVVRVYARTIETFAGIGQSADPGHCRDPTWSFRAGLA